MVGAIFAVLILGLVVWFWRRRKRPAQPTADAEQLTDGPGGDSGDPGATSGRWYYSDGATGSGKRVTNQLATAPWAIPSATLGTHDEQSGFSSELGPNDPSASGVGLGDEREDETLLAKARYVPRKARSPAPPPYSDGA